MSDSFHILFGINELSAVPLNYFIEFRKYCTNHEDLSEFVERIDQIALNRFSVLLLESVIKLLDDFEGYDYEEIAYRRGKILIQIFLHMAGKSPRFRETVAKHSITHWAMLLRLDVIRTEVLMSLTFLSRHMFRAFLSDDAYLHLLSDLLTWWNQVNLPQDQRKYIAEYFKILLEEEYLFLHHCFTSLDKDSFLDLLFMAESLMLEPSLHHAKLHSKFEPSNVRFCVDYFEQLDTQFSELSLEFLFRSQTAHGLNFAHIHTDIGLRLFLLTAIISAAAMHRPDYDDSLHMEHRAIRLICGVLKVLLEVEEIRRRELEAQKATSKNTHKLVESTTKSVEDNNSTLAAGSSLNKPITKNSSDNCAKKECQQMSAKISDVSERSTSVNKNEIRPSEVGLKEESNKTNSAKYKYDGNNSSTNSANKSAGISSTGVNKISTAETTFLKSSNQLRLILLKRQIVPHVASGLREVCVRAIGNLCTKSVANRIIAGSELNAISMLLRCAIKVDPEKPQIPQRAIHALKILCADCEDNRERLLLALELTGNVVGRTQLLANMGLKVEIDSESGKIERLCVISSDEFAQLSSSSSSPELSENGECAMDEEEEDEDEEDESVAEAEASASESTHDDGADVDGPVDGDNKSGSDIQEEEDEEELKNDVKRKRPKSQSSYSCTIAISKRLKEDNEPQRSNLENDIKKNESMMPKNEITESFKIENPNANVLPTVTESGGNSFTSDEKNIRPIEIEGGTSNSNVTNQMIKS